MIHVNNQNLYDLKQMFLNEWPLSRIKNMNLDEYTNLDKTSFCYWLEAKTHYLGSIWGGSSYKFGIYKRRDTSKAITVDNRITDGEYAWFTKYGQTKDSAFQKVREIIISIIENAQSNNLVAIDKIDLGSAYKWKIAFLYSDYKVVNIFKWEALFNGAEFLGFNDTDKSYPNLNNFILSKKNINDDYFEFTQSLWNEFDAPSEEIITESENNIINTKSLNQILYGPPGTGKTFSLNAFVKSEKESNPKIEDKIIKINQDKNFWHLAPGQGGYLWSTLKKGNRLGYEWCGDDEGDLKLLDRNKTENYSIKNYFSYVKKGDYFCIISGKKFYGIAEALHDYDFSRALSDDYDFQTIEVKWVKIFDVPELLSTSYTPTFGRLNGGKRWNSLIAGLNTNNIYLENQQKERSDEKSSSLNCMFTTFHQSFSYEDFIEGIKPNIEESDELRYIIEDGIFKIACDKAANLAGFEDLQDALKSTKDVVKAKFENCEPFYLFIDEINRGNVSAIFGELITLIEEDKRLGKENETRVTLPYSKSETQFCVPPNLYIIGTMNTADRSIEALDTALRRRFSFTEILPNHELLRGKEIGSINLELLLKTINSRIEVLMDRDHTIGHSYFIKLENDDVEGLKLVFKNNIIPLLQEYFYRDYEKIGMVLGQGFVKKMDSNDIVFPDFIKNSNYKTTRYELISIDNDFKIIDAINLLWK